MQESYGGVMRILITGATSGLGLATLKALYKKHQMIIAVRNMDEGKRLKKNLDESIDVMYLDLASFDSIKAFHKALTNKYAFIDVLINNAGVFSDKRAYTDDDFELTMGVNYIGQYFLTRLLVNTLKVSDYSRIINVSSKAGFYGKLNIESDFMKNHPHGFKAYSASKKAQLMMTQYFSKKLKAFNITVNAVHPGSVSTNIWKGTSLLMKLMGPINRKRYASPDDACKVILYLVESEDVKYRTGRLYGPDLKAMEQPSSITKEDYIKPLIEYTEALIRPFI